MTGTIMNSKIERQTLTTRYLGGRGGGLLRLLCRGVSNSGGCRLSNSSFQCKTDLFLRKKDYYSGFPKETPELKFRPRLFFRSIANCSRVLNAHVRRFDSDACATF